MIDRGRQIILNHKNILYDIGDTLVSITEDFETYTRRAIENIYPFVKTQLTSAQFVDRVFEIRSEIRKSAHQTLYEYSFQDFLDKIGLEFTVDADDYEQIEMAYISSELEITVLHSGVHEILRQGKAQNRTQIVATNNFSALHVKEILRRFDLSNYFDAVYISGQMNVRKPSQKFIDTICDRSQLDKKETVIIGDKPKMDILAAYNSNIDSCWLYKEGMEEKGIKPTFIVESLEQIKF